LDNSLDKLLDKLKRSKVNKKPFFLISEEVCGEEKKAVKSLIFTTFS
jgi:hypothetical protein